MKPSETDTGKALRIAQSISRAELAQALTEMLALATNVNYTQAQKALLSLLGRSAKRLKIHLEADLAAAGWELRRTGPQTRAVVPIGSGLHASLEFAGTVGKGALPDPEHIAAAVATDPGEVSAATAPEFISMPEAIFRKVYQIPVTPPEKTRYKRL